MKRAIFLVDDSPVIKAAFWSMNDKKAQINVMLDELTEEKKSCWKTVEDELIRLGKIESTGIRLRYENGCIFVVDKEEDEEK